jgi:hypothetical protein
MKIILLALFFSFTQHLSASEYEKIVTPKLKPGIFHIYRTLTLELPAFLPLSGGRPKSRFAFIKIRRSKKDELPADLNCVYMLPHTEARFPSTPYTFDFCHEAQVSFVPEKRMALKDSAKNMLDRSERKGIFLKFQPSDLFQVEIDVENNRRSPTDFELLLASFKD